MGAELLLLMPTERCFLTGPRVTTPTSRSIACASQDPAHRRTLRCVKAFKCLRLLLPHACAFGRSPARRVPPTPDHPPTGAATLPRASIRRRECPLDSRKNFPSLRTPRISPARCAPKAPAAPSKCSSSTRQRNERLSTALLESPEPSARKHACQRTSTSCAANCGTAARATSPCGPRSTSDTKLLDRASAARSATKATTCRSRPRNTLQAMRPPAWRRCRGRRRGRGLKRRFSVAARPFQNKLPLL